MEPTEPTTSASSWIKIYLSYNGDEMTATTAVQPRDALLASTLAYFGLGFALRRTGRMPRLAPWFMTGRQFVGCAVWSIATMAAYVATWRPLVPAAPPSHRIKNGSLEEDP